MQQQVSFLVEQVREFSVETSDESLTPEHDQIQLRTGVNSHRFPPCQTLGEPGEPAVGLARKVALINPCEHPGFDRHQHRYQPVSLRPPVTL